MAHNSTENLTHHQFGGTFWIGMGQVTQYITSSLKDLAGLGRWSVCSLLSCTGHKLHIIFGYCPCHNQWHQLWSVYAQHRQYFNSTHHYLCPQTAFLLNLGQAIEEWTQQGDKILLLANLNKDIYPMGVEWSSYMCP